MMMQMQIQEQMMMSQNQNQIKDKNQEMFNIRFVSTDGSIINIIAKGEMTIIELLSKYFQRKPEYINEQNAFFIYNAQKLERNDKSKVKDIFINSGATHDVQVVTTYI